MKESPVGISQGKVNEDSVFRSSVAVADPFGNEVNRLDFDQFLDSTNGMNSTEMFDWLVVNNYIKPTESYSHE